MKAQAIGEDISEIIRVAPELSDIINGQIVGRLAPLNSLNIPVSPTVKTFEGVFEGAQNFGLEGKAVKVDFRAFDFNDDGDIGDDNCSGCSCPRGCEVDGVGEDECSGLFPANELKLVCYRMWVHNEDDVFIPWMTGVIERYAIRDDLATPEDEKNAGNGLFRAIIGFSFDNESRGFIAADYKHQDDEDPLKLLSDIRMFAKFLPVVTIISDSRHFRVEQLGLDQDVLQKTAKYTGQGVDNTGPGGEDSVKVSIKHIGRFLENDPNDPLWRGSHDEFDRDLSENDFFGLNMCANIDSGKVVLPGLCDAIGLNIEGEEFLDLSTEANTGPPSSFPDTPTF